MIRKALVLVMSVVICCSFLYAFDSGVAYAVEGACSGVVSALVSQASEPRVSLQGVTFSSESPAIGNVSFVRSDVSTYRSSLRFFADTERSAFLDSIWSEMAALLADEEPFFFEEITEGDIILDGGVRFIPAPNAEPDEYAFVTPYMPGEELTARTEGMDVRARYRVLD